MIVYPIILSVVDTRNYVEDGDRMVPVPGSGDSRDCDRCGRAHEVHATVQYEDGRLAVVGTGCMGRASAFGKKLAGRASTVARLERKLLELRKELSDLEEADRVVDTMPMPDPVWESNRVTVGDGWAMTTHMKTKADEEERLRCAQGSWREKRLLEVFYGMPLRPSCKALPHKRTLELLIEDAEELRDRALQSLQKALSEEP